MRRLNEILSLPSESATSDSSDAAPAADGSADDVCPRCGGTGFVRRATSLDDPAFGKAFPCPCVLDETEAARLERLLRYSNLADLSRHRFETLIRRGRSGVPEHQERFQYAVETAERYAEAPEGWLVIHGPSNAGKTHLAAALANRMIEHGRPVLFVVVPDLLDHLRAAYAPGAEVSYDKLFEQVRNAPVLVLDDLGVQSPTPWAEEKLYQLINHRYNAQAPTVVTTALSPERMEERIRTRLCDERLSRVIRLESGASAAPWLDGLDQPLLRSMTFETFNPRDMSLPTEERGVLENAHRHALEFAQSPEGWLVLYGAPGAGKTHLAAAIANACRDAGRRVLFQVVPDLLDHLRSTFRPDSAVAYDELFDRVRTAPLLVLDDFGAEAGSSWAQEKLYQIINYRYNGRMPTVITTSQPFDQIEERFVARLNDTKVATALWLPSARPYTAAQSSPPRSTQRRGRGGGNRAR